MVGIVHLQNRLHKVLGIKNSIRIICVALMLFFCCGVGVFASDAYDVRWSQYGHVVDGGNLPTILNRVNEPKVDMLPDHKDLQDHSLRVVEITIPDAYCITRKIKIDVTPVNPSNTFYGLTSVDDPTKSIPVQVFVQDKANNKWQLILGNNTTEFITPPQDDASKGGHRGVWLEMPSATECYLGSGTDYPDGAYYCTLLIRLSVENDDSSWTVISEQLVQYFAALKVENPDLKNIDTPPVINVLPYPAATGFDMYNFIDRGVILDVGLVNVVSTLRTADETPFSMNIFPDKNAQTFRFEREGSVNSQSVPYEVSVDDGATWRDCKFTVDVGGRNPLYTGKNAPVDTRNVVKIRAANGADSSKLVGGKYTSAIVFEIITDH